MWPGKIAWYAKSSGTTSDKSKLIPVSQEAIQDCHYKGGKDLLALYYNNNPDTQLFSGKHLIIGGASSINYLDESSYFGDLSSIIVSNLPWWCEWRRTPSKEIALLSNYEEKLEKMSVSTIKEDVHILAGVPSWTLILLEKILAKSGKSKIHEVWPNLELYMHGGINFEPYRKRFEEIFSLKPVNFYENYNASEGFIGLQDSNAAKDMLLMLDYGIYYEFIPKSEWNTKNPKTIELKEVELGREYGLVITTNSGLWRYNLGDVVKFTSISPYRIKITGRTSQCINMTGEELMEHHCIHAIQHLNEQFKLEVEEFHVSTNWSNKTQGAGIGNHIWLIETNVKNFSTEKVSEELDKVLKILNSDYEAKRSTGENLTAPEIIFLTKGTFYAWLKSKNKLGGQFKIPKLATDKKTYNEIMQIHNSI